jgi:hypothetical protein
MNLKRLSFVVFLISFSFFRNICLAQDVENVGIGQWRLHVPFNSGIGVAEGNGKVYCATRYGMFSYTKGDASVERLSRINGLSDFNVSVLRYSPQQNILVLAYDNSNIDLILGDNSIYNIPDIFRKNIVGNKTINDITFVDHYAYLSCGFGIVQMDLKKKENQRHLVHRSQRIVHQCERACFRWQARSMRPPTTAFTKPRPAILTSLIIRPGASTTARLTPAGKYGSITYFPAKYMP